MVYMVIVGILLVIVGVLRLGYRLGWFQPAATRGTSTPSGTTSPRRAAWFIINLWQVLLGIAGTIAALMVLLVVSAALIGLIDLLFIPDEPVSATSTPLPAAARLTLDEREALQNDLLAIPLTDYEWTVSPQEVNLTFDRSNLDWQYVLNLTYMDKLSSSITSGRTNVSTVAYHGTNGESWEYVRPNETNAVSKSAHTLHIRPTNRFAARGSDQFVGLFFQLHPPHDGSTVLRTETTIARDESRPWGIIRTKWADQPLQWEISAMFCHAGGGLIEPSVLQKTPILIGWVHVPGEPLTDKNSVMGTSSVVKFNNNSPLVDDLMVLKIHVPATFPSDVFARVNVRIE